MRGNRDANLDHVGLVVDNLDAAAGSYERLGFTLTPFSRHLRKTPEGALVSRGTGNRCIMLREGYIELLAAVEPLPETAYVRDWTRQYEGIHIVAFGTDAPDRTQARLEQAGIETAGVEFLGRRIDTPDGSAEVSFSLLKPVPEMPEGLFFYIRHETPELLWTVGNTSHANRVVGLVEVLTAVDDLDRAQFRFDRFLGMSAERAGHRRVYALPRGRMVLVAASDLAQDLYGAAPAFVPCNAIMTVASEDLDQTRRTLSSGGVQFETRSGRLVVSRNDATGVMLVIEQYRG